MQKQISWGTQTTNDESFSLMLKQAEAGDKEAIGKIIDFLESDMAYLASFIKLPREDSIQEMKTAMIEAIRHGEIWGGKRWTG